MKAGNMDTRIGSQSSFIAYTNVAKMSIQTRNNSKPFSSIQDPALERTNTRAYTVSFSSDTLQKSESQFESKQNSDLKAFESKQKIETATKDRELEAEKKHFHQAQATDKRQFQEKQRIDKIRFIQQQRQNS